MPYKKYGNYNDENNQGQTNQGQTNQGQIKDMEQILSKEHKNKIIKEYKYVVVDIYGNWCGPCKKVYPEILELQNKWSTVKFVKEDIDKNLSNVNGVPYFEFYKKGKYICNSIGANSKRVEQKIKDMYED